MKKSILLAALVLPAIAFTSCIGSDGENRHEATLSYGGSQCFNYVTDMQTGESFISTDPQYTFLLNYTDGQITPSLTNIKLTENGSALAFKLPALTVSTSSQQYSYTCSGHDIMPEGQSTYTFDTFSLKAIDRVLSISGQYYSSPVYDISYTIDNRYSVKVFPLRYDLLGSTTAVAGTNSNRETSPIYTILLTPSSKTASITITGAKFNSSMVAADIAVKDVPYTVSSYGINIKTDTDVKYQLRDRAGEIKDAYLSNIVLSLGVPSGTTSLSFHADITGIQGSADTSEYDVAASLSYYLPQSSN